MNDLSKVVDKLLAQGLLALRGTCVMPRLVNSDYSNFAAQQGASIDVPIPSAIKAQAVTPGATSQDTGDISPVSATIKLDRWMEAPFYLTDKDLMEANRGVIPMQASEAVKAIANDVNATAKDTAFIKCFPDDSGVYARVLTETELDTLRVKSRTFNGNEKRTPERMDRRFKILHLQRALSGWEGLEFEDGSPIPFSKEMIKELWEVNPNLMGIIYSCVSSELSFVKAAELRDWCGRLADNAPSCDECRETWELDGLEPPCGACTSSEEELLPDNQQAMHIWQICDIHARDFVGMAGQARPIRLEAVRAECDRTGDPEGNFQKVMLIEAVLFPVRYLKKRH